MSSVKVGPILSVPDEVSRFYVSVSKDNPFLLNIIQKAIDAILKTGHQLRKRCAITPLCVRGAFFVIEVAADSHGEPGLQRAGGRNVPCNFVTPGSGARRVRILACRWTSEGRCVPGAPHGLVSPGCETTTACLSPQARCGGKVASVAGCGYVMQ